MTIVATGITYAYTHGVPVLSGVDVRVESGSFMAILGVNGCGKSTLVSCMSGLMKPDEGKVLLDGEDVHSMPRARRAERLAFVPQHCHANRMTVFDTVLMGRRPRMEGGVTDADLAAVEAVLDDFGLGPLALRYVDELSGGEFQKVILARAIAQEAGTVLLDEPTNNLDLANQHEVMSMAADHASTRGIAMAAVLHDVNLALRYCDRFLLIRHGEVHACGSVEVVDEQAILDVYGLASDIIEHGGHKLVVPR